MQIESEIKLDFDDVLIRPKRSTINTRTGVDLTRSYSKFYSSKDNSPFNGIPIIASNMDTVGTFQMAKALASQKICTALHKHYSEDEFVDFFTKNEDIYNYVFYTIGSTEADLQKLRSVSLRLTHSIEEFPKRICIDVANGYIKSFQDTVQRVRQEYPTSTIMAGNVSTPELVQQLLEKGADIIKVGTGGGSPCLTRRVTGVGYPQLSVIIETADAAHGYGGLICSDGGCRYPGDVAKAFGANADFVMLGSMFAGTDECDGEWEYDEITRDKKYLKFYGMASREAQEKYNGGITGNRASEGREVYINYKGPVLNVVQEILGGLSSCCTYVGCTRLKDLSKCTTFIRVNRQLNDFLEKNTIRNS